MSSCNIIRPTSLIVRISPIRPPLSDWTIFSSTRTSRRILYHSGRHHLGPATRTQSSLNTAVILSVIGGSLFGSLYYYNRKPVHPIICNSSLVGDIAENEQAARMAGISLPGRPGNLTAEQEIKLQEMWTATLKVFGVPGLFNSMNGSNGDEASLNGSETHDQTEKGSRAGTSGSEKKSKKRMGLFSKKHHEVFEEKDKDGVSAIDGDDKYGQTKEFNKVLASQSPEDLRQAFWSMVKHDNPDGLLLRFLRARKWNVQNALAMLVATMHWRGQEIHVDDDIMRRGEGGAAEDGRSSDAAIKREGNDFLAQTRLGKSFIHGTDKEGRPMCFVNVRLHRQGEQSEASVERYTVFTIETARLLLESNVDTAVSAL